MRKAIPAPSLLVMAILFLFILPSCNNNTVDIPFPVSDSGFSQPAVMPLKFSEPKKLNWVTVKTGKIKPATRKLDIDALPSTPYDALGFKAFPRQPEAVHFDFKALPDSAFNMDKSPSLSIKFKISVLIPPTSIKAAAFSQKSGTSLSIFDMGQAQGLLTRSIFCLFKDKSGLIWIATDKGLNRFDGEYMQTYGPFTSGIGGMVEDNDGRIWFLRRGGIGFIDPSHGIRGFYKDENNIFDDIQSLMKDDKGRIWISHGNRGVVVIDPKTMTFKTFDNHSGLSGTFIWGIFEDDKKNIWITTNGGADIINPVTGRIKYLKKSNGLSSDTLMAITGDKKGRVWMAFQNGGINSVDIEEGIITRYGKAQGLNNPYTLRLLYDNKNRIWMAADHGFVIADIAKGMVKYSTDTEGITNDNILDLLLDDNQKVWVAASVTGLYVIDHNGDMAFPLGKKNMSTLFEDASGNIWAGTTNEGIFIMNWEKKILKQLNRQQGFGNNTIQSFSQVDGKIWVTNNGGLDIIDLAHKTIEHTGKKEGLLDNVVYSLLKDKHGNVWITGPSEGVEMIDSAKTMIRSINKAGGLSDNNISSIKQDRQGLIWIATSLGGVDVIDPETWSVRYLNNMPGLSDTCNRVLMLDQYNRMWIGTDKGIYIADVKQGTITSITTSEGLSNNYISSLNEYKGLVIAGTHNKVNIIKPVIPGNDSIAKTNQEKWEVSLLAKSEGLILQNQSWDVNIITREGQYLWGDNGISMINNIEKEPKSGATYITGLNIMSQPQYFANSPLLHEHDTLWTADSFYLKTQTPVHTGYVEQQRIRWDSISGPYNLPVNLTLPYDQNFIQFQFAQVRHSRQEATMYSYILQGIDTKWSGFTSNPYTDNYMNLPPGNYTFKVCSKSVSGRWGKPAVFSFSITPPWWKTWWAYCVYILSFIGLIWVFIHYRSKKLIRENRLLEDKVLARTNEVKQQADELKTVNQISQALVSQADLHDLINLVGNQLKDLFKANIVYIALLDKKTKIINFPYQYGDQMPPLKLGEGLTSKIILTGEPLLINKDVHEEASSLGINRVGLPAASYLGVPIPVSDEIIGVLSIQSTETENCFAEKDKRLLATIAANVGVAIRKARLFEEVKMANADADIARKNAEEANAAKSAFLSTVSHELRTPLTSVLGFAKITKKRLEEKIFPITDKSDPKTVKTIEQISGNLSVVISEGERLTNLINDVLDLAKIEAGKMEWNMEPVHISDVVERAIAATSSLFEQKNLRLERKIETDLPDVSGDRDKLIQVVVNLLSNAVKFTNAGAVTCSVFRKDNGIVVGITDTGIGIAPQDHDKVFEQFKQVGDTLTDKPKGTGLGLPICKEIVEHHNGRIWLESELGQGSTFYFMLPVHVADEKEIRHIQLNDLVRQLKKRMQQSHPSITNNQNATILVVDDDEGIRSLLKQELTEAGYMVEEAVDGKDAITKIRANRPDLVILDVMMPEMNGFDVAAILKNDPQTMEIPIIILSVVQDKSRGFRIGVDRYLTKPIDTGLLFSEIGNLLEQGKSRKKVMVVDEDTVTVRTLTDVLEAKGYQVVESDGKELVEKAIAAQPDIIILNSMISDKQEIVKTLRFEKGLENVLFLIYQ